VFDYIRDTARIEGKYDHSELSADLVKADADYAGSIASFKADIKAGESFITVSGTFKSVGKVPCPSPVAIAVGYNAAGAVCSVREEWLTDESGDDIDELAPGKTANFEFLLDNLTGEVRRVDVLAGCSFYGMP